MDTYTDCINIITDKNTLTHSELSIKWENFNKKFPHLYEMLVTTENIDIKTLKFICESAEKQKTLTLEKQLENEFEIGDHLAKKYIYENFPEPTQEQKEFIKNTLKKKLNKDST